MPKYNFIPGTQNEIMKERKQKSKIIPFHSFSLCVTWLLQMSVFKIPWPLPEKDNNT